MGRHLTEMVSFTAALEKRFAAQQEFGRKVLQYACLAATGSIVVGEPAYSPGTPVDTGYARASWQPSLNTPVVDLPQGVRERGASYDTSGPGQWAADVLSTIQLGDTYWLTNGVPYIGALEYGHSQQAPAGMVRLTAVAFPDIVARAVALAGGAE